MSLSPTVSYPDDSPFAFQTQAFQIHELQQAWGISEIFLTPAADRKHS